MRAARFCLPSSFALAKRLYHIMPPLPRCDGYVWQVGRFIERSIYWKYLKRSGPRCQMREGQPASEKQWQGWASARANSKMEQKIQGSVAAETAAESSRDVESWAKDVDVDVEEEEDDDGCDSGGES